ncbi:MAG: cellulase-like family protein [Bacteroidales bacterium]|nr:cellulase-like family protein [Bacteroidales bacterium]
MRPGAGYEDWDRALSELVERGYDAIRIDAFPHLIHEDPEREYLLLPHWSTQDWGSPEINRVLVQPHLNLFLERCRAFHIRVGLSSWFRTDEEDVRMKLDSPAKLGEAWLAVLKSVEEGGLLDTILYVDLCNEWTGDAWCPFFVNDPPEALWTGWDTPKSKQWMGDSIALLRQQYPEIPFTFSFTGEISEETLSRGPFKMLDFLEPHIWMTSYKDGEFYRRVGYNYERFDYAGYRNMALYGKGIYEEKKEYWQTGLVKQIRLAAKWSEQLGQPLITTECWGVVDYKDLPMLDWGYVKELCALGTLEAAKTGRWLAVATSNFCGPQFVGMWRDVEWHRQLTDLIHLAPVSQDLQDSLLAGRMRAI